MTKDYWDAPPFRRVNQGMTPMNRDGTWPLRTMANAVYFLASDQGSFINGHACARRRLVVNQIPQLLQVFYLLTADGDLDPVVDRSYLICRYRLLRSGFTTRRHIFERAP